MNIRLKYRSMKLRKVDYVWIHRVDRVLSFLSSRPNWDSPTPSHAGECVPPSLVPGGGGEGTLASRRGSGRSQFQRGDIHCGTLVIYVLCVWIYIPFLLQDMEGREGLLLVYIWGYKERIGPDPLQLLHRGPGETLSHYKSNFQEMNNY